MVKVYWMRLIGWIIFNLSWGPPFLPSNGTFHAQGVSAIQIIKRKHLCLHFISNASCMYSKSDLPQPSLHAYYTSVRASWDKSSALLSLCAQMDPWSHWNDVWIMRIPHSAICCANVACLFFVAPIPSHYALVPKNQIGPRTICRGIPFSPVQRPHWCNTLPLLNRKHPPTCHKYSHTPQPDYHEPTLVL